MWEWVGVGVEVVGVVVVDDMVYLWEREVSCFEGKVKRFGWWSIGDIVLLDLRKECVWSRLESSGKWEGFFFKNDMIRYDNFTCGNVELAIVTIIR